jgi:citrate lyase subunit beta/citryl-CoA lyase
VGTTARACRSYLAVPASDARKVDGARHLAVDAVFLDLEDGVAPAAKERARHRAVWALNAAHWQAPRRSVRINALDTPWAYGDVVAVVEGAGANLDCIVIPKARSAEDVRWLGRLLDQLEGALGLPAGRLAIDVLIEDAMGLSRAEEIAGASERVDIVLFGSLDFSASVGSRGRSCHDQAKERLLVAARSHGRRMVDGPCLEIFDLDALRREAEHAAALGYDGKIALHPAQVPVVHEVFTPTGEEYEAALAVLCALEDQQHGQRGAVLHGGQMIDEASRKRAEALLSRAVGAEVER